DDLIITAQEQLWRNLRRQLRQIIRSSNHATVFNENLECRSEIAAAVRYGLAVLSTSSKYEVNKNPIVQAELSVDPTSEFVSIFSKPGHKYIPVVVINARHQLIVRRESHIERVASPVFESLVVPQRIERLATYMDGVEFSGQLVRSGPTTS